MECNLCSSTFSHLDEARDLFLVFFHEDMTGAPCVSRDQVAQQALPFPTVFKNWGLKSEHNLDWGVLVIIFFNEIKKNL